MTFPGFAQHKAKPDASLPITAITELTQSDHLGFICGGCSGANRNGRCRRTSATLWCNNYPCSIGSLLITSALIIPVATRPWLALCRDGSASRTTNDRTNCGSPAAAYCAANNGSRSSAYDCPGYRVLCGRVLHWHRQRNGQKS
jgi:hypothetical protein